MKRLRILCLLAFPLLAGCVAVDGGPVGTGVAAISGNVVAVDPTAAAALATDSASVATLPFPVTVTLDEAPTVTDTTDANGNFELRGSFSGSLTLRFKGASLDVTTTVDVPAGSVVVLQDIRLRAGRVEPDNVRQLDFRGRIVMVDCAADGAGELLVDDRAPAVNQFLVRLATDTELSRRGGRTLTCSDLRVGDAVGVQGEIRLSTDRTIDALAVVVDPAAPEPEPGPERPLRFTGTVVSVDCSAGNLVLMTRTGGARIHLLPTTKYFVQPARPEPQPATCADITAGGFVQGNGMVRLHDPGAVNAERVIFRPAISG